MKIRIHYYQDIREYIENGEIIIHPARIFQFVDSDNDKDFAEQLATIKGYCGDDYTVEYLDDIRRDKYAEFDSACSAAIVAGFGVNTTHGAKHYNLSVTDQNNLDNAMNTIRDVKLGLRSPEIIANGIPFKMTDGDCLYYTEDDIKTIDLYRTGHILYHRTYLSALLKWCDSLPEAELAGIVYGATLPEAYQAHVDAVMSPIKELTGI